MTSLPPVATNINSQAKQLHISFGANNQPNKKKIFPLGLSYLKVSGTLEEELDISYLNNLEELVVGGDVNVSIRFNSTSSSLLKITLGEKYTQCLDVIPPGVITIIWKRKDFPGTDKLFYQFYLDSTYQHNTDVRLLRRNEVDPNFLAWLKIVHGSEFLDQKRKYQSHAHRVFKNIHNLLNQYAILHTDFTQPNLVSSKMSKLANSDMYLKNLLKKSTYSSEKKFPKGQQSTKWRADTTANYINSVRSYTRFLGYQYEVMDQFTAEVSSVANHNTNSEFLVKSIFDTTSLHVYHEIMTKLRTVQKVIDKHILHFYQFRQFSKHNSHKNMLKIGLHLFVPFIEILLRFTEVSMTITEVINLNFPVVINSESVLLKKFAQRQSLLLFLLDEKKNKVGLVLVRKHFAKVKNKTFKLVRHQLSDTASIYIFFYLMHCRKTSENMFVGLNSGRLLGLRRLSLDFMIHTMGLSSSSIGYLRADQEKGYTYSSKFVWLSGSINQLGSINSTDIVRLTLLLQLGLANESDDHSDAVAWLRKWIMSSSILNHFQNNIENNETRLRRKIQTATLRPLDASLTSSVLVEIQALRT